MNFTLKTLVAAVALVAAGSANAALDGGATGNGELQFILADSSNNNYMVFDFTPKAGFGTLAINDFLPTNRTAKSATDGTAIPGSTGAAEADGVNLSFDLTSNAAFTAFAANNTDTTKWQWSVVAKDFTPTTTAGLGAADNRRFLTTVKNGVTSLTLTAAQVGNLSTATNTEVRVNNTAPGVVDPSVYLANAGSADNWNTDIGATWKGQIAAGISNGVNTSADFYYITGNGSNPIEQKFANSAKWAFNFDATTGAASVSYTTAAAIPESDTYAMLLAGLGVMGLVARRRLAA